MKSLLIAILLFGCPASADAQIGSVLHPGTFKKAKLVMRSKPYRPDDWEKPYYDSAIRNAFPSDLMKSPEKYRDKTIYLIGVVDSVFVNAEHQVTFLLDNKYWDYIEDYSIQDEVMFVSPKGDGRFAVTIPPLSGEQLEEVKRFPAEKKLFFVYGTLQEGANGYPVLAARQVKYIPHALYTTKVFSYDIMRDEQGDPVSDKQGRARLSDFRMLKPAGKGQNK